jgi:hypothetical protein
MNPWAVAEINCPGRDKGPGLEPLTAESGGGHFRHVVLASTAVNGWRAHPVYRFPGLRRPSAPTMRIYNGR